MTKGQRIISVLLSGVLLVSGFAFGQWTGSSNSAAAEKTNQTLADNFSPSGNSEGSPAYLSDYQMGYREGYNAGLGGQEINSLPVRTNAAYGERTGYHEGYKIGFADGYKMRVQSGPAAFGSPSIGNEFTTQPVVYRRTRTRPVYYKQRKGSKLKTVLTIAAPAAIGAGVGGLAGGKKGAGIGALIGGGGGALYHLLKKRD